MNFPKMILFDYGQTIMSESLFDGVNGTRAVLEKSICNPLNASPEEIFAFEKEMNNEIGRYNPHKKETYNFEVHNYPFQKYLYEYFDVEFSASPMELEKIFWDNAAPAVPTKGVEKMLKYLDENGIKSGIISNLSFSGDCLKNRLDDKIPSNNFEFIIASSDYIFRKPNRRIFELALRKSKLSAAEVWYCGDNGFYDVDGSANAGMTAVWYTGALLNNTYLPKENHVKIGDWDEMILLLEKLKK
ncbi:MAG: HAD family hydrolase [Oscillospiraceae bacterium]